MASAATPKSAVRICQAGVTECSIFAACELPVEDGKLIIPLGLGYIAKVQDIIRQQDQDADLYECLLFWMSLKRDERSGSEALCLPKVYADAKTKNDGVIATLRANMAYFRNEASYKDDFWP